ncbi:MAG: hemerythrin domain-containing protein [Dehalococcoidia bacterium]
MDQPPRISSVLEHDHRQIDAGFSRFHDGLASGEWRFDAFASASNALRRHIYLEEAILFPPLRRAGMVAPVRVMVREHGEIWEALDAVGRAIETGGDPAGAFGLSTMLQTILEAHNFKEEQALYPTADQVLGDDVARQVQRALAEADVPPGWRPEALANRG